MLYLALKHLHLTCVALSLLLFIYRGGLMYLAPQQLKARWIKIVPHVVDTFLLLSAIGLCLILRQYPFVSGWVTAKVIGVIVYIGLGTIAIKRRKSWAFILALLCFAYIASVALHHSPSAGLF